MHEHAACRAVLARIVRACNVGPFAADYADQATFLQLSNCTPNCHPGRSVVQCQCGFRWQALIDRQFITLYLSRDVVSDLHIHQFRSARIEAWPTVGLSHGDQRRHPLTCTNTWLTLRLSAPSYRHLHTAVTTLRLEDVERPRPVLEHRVRGLTERRGLGYA